MDYVVGSVAALITGNVTPSRPRILKRALTPTKHQPSPNVTPKSEFVDDRSIFLSPSMQKKKAIVKKSPKRIFQNPDLETTEDGEGTVNLSSPKADKVKKHLKDDLDTDVSCNTSVKEPKSPKNKGINKKESILSHEKAYQAIEQQFNESTPKKKKKNRNSVSDSGEIPTTENFESAAMEVNTSEVKTSKKKIQKHKLLNDVEDNKENANSEIENELVISHNNKSTTEPKMNLSNSESVGTSQGEMFKNVSNKNPKNKNKKCKKRSKQQTAETKSDSSENVVVNEEKIVENQSTPKKKKKKDKKSKCQQNKSEAMDIDEPEDNIPIRSKKSKIIVNPNAITNKASDSEHESDDDIKSDNEEINKKVFASGSAVEESSDEDNEKAVKEVEPQKNKVDEKKKAKGKGEINIEDEIKRTLFVGNVPFSVKCKKDIKKIFNKHGQIETIRIRTVPVKDGRYTPKLAVITNELHPERSTVNVYIKYANEESVEKALAENNTVLNEHHLRVSRSSHTGAEHDPKCSIFVGNLPFAIEDEILRQKFENCGEIESVRIIRDKKTNAGKGFGYVNFTSKDGVELALALTEEDLTIKNRIIRVKRCTQATNKQKQSLDKGDFKRSFNQNSGNQQVQSGQRQKQGGQRGNQGGHRGNKGGHRGNQGGQRGNYGGQRQYQGGQRGNQSGQRYGAKDEAGQDGAHRRIIQKRKNQDFGGGDGPPNKRQKNINQPNKEKKVKKEFVGMTAEKKKKRKFDKGQKKKKALSEILTK